MSQGVQVGEGSAARIADGDEETTLGLIWNMLDCCLVKPVNFIDEVRTEWLAPRRKPGHLGNIAICTLYLIRRII